MKIKEFLFEIKLKLALGKKDNDFSYWIEDALARNYKQFEQENAYLAREMNDYLPDICEQMEPGMESYKFYQELSDEVDRLLKLLYE